MNISNSVLDWWMAQLAAQDYFSRLQQASGFGQMPFSPNDLGGGFPPGLAASLGMPPMNGSTASGGGSGSGGGSSRGGGGESKGNSRNKKERKNNSNNNSSNNSTANSYKVSRAMRKICPGLELV